MGMKTLLLAVAIAASVTTTTARAAEPLTVFCAGATAAVIQQMSHAFQQKLGRPVVITVGTMGQLSARIAAGEHADVVILSAPVLEALDAKGGIISGTRADVGRTGIGVGIRAGSIAPDLSTPDALKAALLAAPAIATMDPASASSGAYFAGLLQKMGIADAVRPKELLAKGGYSCDMVAAGKASLCVQNISEILPVNGVVVAAPFPAAVQNDITYAAAVTSGSTSPKDARAFIADATSSAHAAVWKRAGFEPAR